MKHLVVNADDFGASHGVNRGVIEAHRYGVVTSASLLVNWPSAEEAACLARENPSLSVGLHACLVDERPEGARQALEAQLRRFRELLRREPTHLDSHHHVHAHEPLLPMFRELAQGLGIPLRDSAGIPYCSRFFGQWDGESHPEQVSVASLISILESDLRDGVIELACHPGYVDATLTSSYRAEREVELRTLCDRRLRRFLDRRGMLLIGFGAAPATPAPA